MLNLLKSAVSQVEPSVAALGRAAPALVGPGGFKGALTRTMGRSQLMTMAAGGYTANAFSDSENRGPGTFLKGALTGGIAGAGINAFFRNKSLMRMGGAMLANRHKIGNRQLRKASNTFARGAVTVGHMMHTKSARMAAFGSGAMLVGGYYGSDRSRSRGFNSNRGSRFGS